MHVALRNHHYAPTRWAVVLEKGEVGRIAPLRPDQLDDGPVDRETDRPGCEPDRRQRRAFYEKLGFTVFGTLEDHPIGGARYFMQKRLDVLMVNDGEARELSGEYNLSRAARWIRERGPRIVVIKKGEHGALLFTEESVFFAPGYPLDEVFDPTGAGDSFAGGFMGWLGYVGTVNDEELRRAMIYGSATGSLVCERFGMERLVDVGPDDVHERVRAFRRLTAFEHPVQVVNG